MNQEIQTVCPYCGVGCGLIAQVTETAAVDRRVIVRGDTTHPANFGRLCSKGSAVGETLGAEGRLLYPSIRGKRVDWREALDYVANEFNRIIHTHGKESIAFYVSGQLLTEDYYVANKLIKGFIGNSHIDSNSRLCMSSAVAGHKRAFGSDTVPTTYEDLEQADCVVMVGANMAWCHPVLFQRIKAAQLQRKTRVIVVDPRRTESTEIAELHLAIKPSTDTLLLNGLLVYLADHNAIDLNYQNYCEGAAETLAQARAEAPDVQTVSNLCDVPATQIQSFYDLFLRHKKVVTCFSMGVNQSSAGTDKVNSIINCHLLTGRIGKTGMGPLSLTGQPNAMGGREVGALANLLAAHMEYQPDHLAAIQQFWQAPHMTQQPGLKAVDLFRAIADKKIKAVWIMATNPLVSLPEASQIKSALENCELVVMSDCIADTETTRKAHVLFPAQGWGEKNGTVTNSERRISRQRPLLKPLGEAQPDWWIISQVAQRMGYADQFNYTHPAQIFTEHARLSGLNNAPLHNRSTRDFDISGLGHLTEAEYDALQPTQWPISAHSSTPSPRFFSTGNFYTATGKAQFIPIQSRSPVNLPDQQYPFILNTGRIRDQWHTMTRTGLVPRLNNHFDQPFVLIHPLDAEQQNIMHQQLVEVASRYGQVLVRALLTEDMRRSEVFIPMHWSGVFAAQAGVGQVVNAALDPVSAQPEFKHTPVKLKAVLQAWYGLLLLRKKITPPFHYWSCSRSADNFRYWLADQQEIDLARAKEYLAQWCDGLSLAWSEYCDEGSRNYRLAAWQNGQLQAIFFAEPSWSAAEILWLESLFSQVNITTDERNALLAGRFSAAEDKGAIVCACFTVGEKQITTCVREQQLTTPEQVGNCLKAGTNCGSCLPRIQQLLLECQ